MKYLVISSLIVFIFSCTPKVVKEPPPTVEQPDLKYLWAFNKTVNVRAENSANANKVATLTDGDSVKIIRNNKGWYEVLFNNGTKGWIRSDLLGTKNMSAFRKAITFSNNLKETENITLYFDKEIQHKRIFLEYPEDEYSSRKNIENKTNEIGKNYQEKVYPGQVTIKVIEPGEQSEFLTIDLSGSPNADVNLPVFNFGILEEIDIKNLNELKLVISVNENIPNADMLKEARRIAGSFPLTFKKVNVTFKNKSQECILSFVEDATGENYKFNQCL